MPDTDRRGEKAGWRFGWLGCFLWVAIVATIELSRGRPFSGTLGWLLTVVAAAAILLAAPWRHPREPYWKLMTPIYLLFGLTLVWFLLLTQTGKETRLSPWSLLSLLPVMSPLYLMGRRRWADGETAPASPTR